MCGIAGIFSRPGGASSDPRTLRRMIARLDHRGPEERGVYVDKRVALGFMMALLIEITGAE
jgi:asparagine synthase (glutamine-hydrolysing)